MERTIMPGFIMNVLPSIFYIMAITASCKATTDFCSQPLGMERWIITDDQITASTTSDAPTHSAKEARLNNSRSWCSETGSTITDQWVKVDLKKPMSITGIKIQGDPIYSQNYITKFKLEYNYDGGTTFFGKIDSTYQVKEFIGANNQNELRSIQFLTKPFTARYVRLRPVEIDSGGNDVCARFELNGCAYVCNAGLGIENGASLPSGVSLNASSAESGREAMHGRLSGPLSWCAKTNSSNAYLQIDFGKVVTMSGFAIQGDPLQSDWVKDFYIDYGTELTSLEAYTEGNSTKLFIGNKDQNTIVVHWFQVRLAARYLRIKPNQYNKKKCLRIEVIGCESAFVGEIGAENRALHDYRFFAYGWNEWLPGRYRPKDGRLNNDRPWGIKRDRLDHWFKVDLGRIMLVNGVSTQGDPTYGSNYFPDYKLEFSLQDNGVVVIDVKEEDNSSDKVFPGNANNMGVKFNFLKKNQISARYLQFRENTKPLNDYCLRIEIYAYPQVCSESFGLIVGEPSTYLPIITSDGGVTPSSNAQLNSIQAWCGTGNSTFILYDLGSEKQVNGIAIQGDPIDDKWVKTFKVQYGSTISSLTTYQVYGEDKVFVGCNSSNLIVYNWFSSEITTRYLKIIPKTFKSQACLRLNIYGCPALGCFKPVGIQSSATIADSFLTSSTSGFGNEAYKGRLNAGSAWSACQHGPCGPREVIGSKPWIQLCLAKSQLITGLVIQGFGQIEDLAHVSSFTIKYAYTISGRLYDYKIKSTIKTFVASTGRYGSKQITFPRALTARCIRLVVQSQSSTSKNVGLRWEVLGCTPDICNVHQPCKNNATCTKVVGGYKCNCISGYTGKNCTIDINECKSNPCSANGKCIDEVNRYKCVCNYIFTGQNCESRINPCKIANCNNGTCISKNVSYSCNCYAGYTGMYCNKEIDECSLKPKGICRNGKCISGNGTISCSCFAGYSGRRCETDLWPCRSNPCLRGGKCTNKLGNGFSCKCRAGNGGTRCEKKIEQCDAKPCKNGGICKHVEQNGQIVLECGCKGGYGGPFCEYYYGDSLLSLVLKLERSQAYNETAFKLAIANSLNSHCIKFPDNCPKKDVSAKNQARSQQNLPMPFIFYTADVKILQGYPKTKQNSAVEMQFYVTVPASFTGRGNSTADSGALAVFNPDIVKMSLETKSDFSSYGFQILSVELLTTKNESSSQTSIALGTFMIVVAILASLSLICFGISALQCLRARRLTSERTANGNPQKSKKKSRAMSLPVLLGSIDNKYYINGEQEINGSNLQISHYQELQNDETPHDPDYLHPDVNKEGFNEPLQFDNSRL